MFDHTSRANAVYDVASAKWHTYAELAEEVYRVAETLHAPADFYHLVTGNAVLRQEEPSAWPAGHWTSSIL